jgi:hypothetical protein
MKTCLRRRRSVVQEETANKTERPSVSFNLDRTSFHEIEHLDDLSMQQIEAVWYSHEEYAEIKQAIKPIVREMIRNKSMVPEESDEFTSRGLGTSSLPSIRSKVGNKRSYYHLTLFSLFFISMQNVEQDWDHVQRHERE